MRSDASKTALAMPLSWSVSAALRPAMPARMMPIRGAAREPASAGMVPDRAAAPFAAPPAFRKSRGGQSVARLLRLVESLNSFCNRESSGVRAVGHVLLVSKKRGPHFMGAPSARWTVKGAAAKPRPAVGSGPRSCRHRRCSPKSCRRSNRTRSRRSSRR